MRYVGLDLSTKAGVVALDADGEVIYKEEIKNKCDLTASIEKHKDEITKKIEKDDFIVIEDFGFNSQRAVQMGGIGHGVRGRIYGLKKDFRVIAPKSLKKFVTGNGNADKRELAVRTNERWGFFDKSDNITDAYALAQVGRALDGKMKTTKAEKEVLKKVRLEKYVPKEKL